VSRGGTVGRKAALKCSEDEEDDEDEEEQVEQEPAEPVEGEDADAEARPKAAKKKSGKTSMELVEYSPDELRDVDKEMLSAEITQLEGRFLETRRGTALTSQRTRASSRT